MAGTGINKVLIITYYNGLNPGTILQAYGVQQGLREAFPKAEVKFLQFEGYSRYFKKKPAVSPTGKSNVSVPAPPISKIEAYKIKLFNYLRLLKYRNVTKKIFKETNEYFAHFSYDEEKYVSFANNYDLISIGSDTILERIERNGQIGVMWGNRKIESPQILFAASAGDCAENRRQQGRHDEIKERLSKFKFLGVRDNILRKFLSDDLKINAAEIVKQPDPTYLLPLEMFKLRNINANKIKSLKGKIAFFHFDKKCPFRTELGKLLKANGYSLVTSEYDPTCDLSFKAIVPFEWGDIFRYCDVVFTERFHDTVFGLRHAKPVFTFDWREDGINAKGTSKRTEILNDFGLLDHHFNMLSQKVDNQLLSQIEALIAKFNPKEIKSINERLINDAKAILHSLNSKVS